MGFFSDWIDTDGAARDQALREQREFTESQQGEVPVATQGQQLPANKPKPGGGPRYSAAVTPEGRVHSEQLIKNETAKTESPLGLDVRDVLSQKEYAKDRSDPSFVNAPTMERAFGVDKSEPGWGMNGYGGKIISGLAKGIAPVVAGGLMGGRKGAMEGWQGAVENRQKEQAAYDTRVQELQSDRVMKEAYEMARMNYESDYNSGKTDLPFSDYLAQAMEAIGTKSSGLYGQLVDAYGLEEGMRQYERLQAANRRTGGGGGGGGGVDRTKLFQLPDGSWITEKEKNVTPTDPSQIRPRTTYTDAPRGPTSRSTLPPKASDF